MAHDFQGLAGITASTGGGDSGLGGFGGGRGGGGGGGGGGTSFQIIDVIKLPLKVPQPCQGLLLPAQA